MAPVERKVANVDLLLLGLRLEAIPSRAEVGVLNGTALLPVGGGEVGAGCDVARLATCLEAACRVPAAAPEDG
jgi:hypothetical protein